jgi:hypothetical protein
MLVRLSGSSGLSTSVVLQQCVPGFAIQYFNREQEFITRMHHIFPKNQYIVQYNIKVIYDHKFYKDKAGQHWVVRVLPFIVLSSTM